MMFNKLVEVWRAPLVDDPYGSRRDWEHAVRVAAGPAAVQPLNAGELLADRETTVTKLKIYLRLPPPESTDRVLIDGAWWEVDGEPFAWTFRTASFNGTQHVKLVVRRVQH